MKKLRLSAACLIVSLALPVLAARVYAGFGTTVPVSAEMATNIANSFFPVSLKAGAGNLFLTNPVVVFIDDKRIGLKARLQAYDHRPEEGIAISEEGEAVVSGVLGYDAKTRQVLLFGPRIDKLSFDTDSELTRRLRAEVLAAWDAQVTNPVRADVPPHPFIAPFKDGIQDISYERRSIFIQVWYP